VNERNPENWEKGFDLKALPDVELVDGADTASEPAAGSPPSVEAAPESAVPTLDEEVAPEAEVEPAQIRSPEVARRSLAEREVDPRQDPFAGWVSGHPLAEGYDLPTPTEQTPAAPEFDIVAAGEDPFAGRFAAAQATREVVSNRDETETDPAKAETQSEATEEPVARKAERVARTERVLPGAAAVSARATAVGQTSVTQGALPAHGSSAHPASTPAREESRNAPLAEVVPITSGRGQSAAVEGPDAESAEASAMQAFLAGLSDEELDRAVELFEQQVSGGADLDDSDDDFPPELLDPFAHTLETTFGEVELFYRIEEIEDIIDARLPDVARRDSEWWSNRAGRSDLGHAAAWVRSGWWSYPDLDAGRVRFRRPV
jgi:hypothetical protein